MRVYLKGYDIDNVGYNVDYSYQEKPTQATDNVLYGEANIDRSKYVFKNINLRSILGNKFDNKKTINIKVVDIKAIQEYNVLDASGNAINNIIDYNSPAILRTSNVVLSGLTFFNGKNENVIGQYTNFNPNEELVFQNVQFHRGDLSDFQHFYHYNHNNQGGSTLEWYRFLSQETSLTAIDSLTRYRVTSSTITQLNNKIMRGSRATRTDDNYFSTRVQDSGDGTLPTRVTGQVNNTVTITILPENNTWFHKRFTDDIDEDEAQNEITAYLPSHQINIDLTFELRDILTDKLQPVITEPNGKVYPSIEFVLDIY